MTVTTEVKCPLCFEFFDADIDPNDAEQEIDCPECGETLGVEYDKATEGVTLVELLECCADCNEPIEDCKCTDEVDDQEEEATPDGPGN